MVLFGVPIHPLLVHFPIAFFIGAWLLDGLARIFKNEGLYSAAVVMFILGAVFSCAAVVTGLLEMSRLRLHHPLVYAHRNYALACTATSFIAITYMWFMRANPRVFRRIFTIACWLTAGLVMAAGHCGGDMVYQFGVGVSS